jgi:hypothetical protein
MNKEIIFDSELIAPCGMNCGICVRHFGYLKNGEKTKKCPGCIVRGKGCGLFRKYCKRIDKKEVRFCYECNEFPCQVLNKLDKKYRTKYGMSIVDNLKEIKNKGMTNFLKNQEQKFVCKEGIICVHNQKIYPKKSVK